jgi:hypothetical protein
MLLEAFGYLINLINPFALQILSVEGILVAGTLVRLQLHFVLGASRAFKVLGSCQSN